MAKKTPKCPFCGGTKHHKAGVINRAGYKKQRYQCLTCGKYFFGKRTPLIVPKGE